MRLTRKVTLAAIVFLVLIALVATSMLFAVAAMRNVSALLSDEVVPKLDARGDFSASMTHALGELETFIFSHDATDLDEAQQAVAEAQEALVHMGREATDRDQREDPADVADTQRLLEHQAIMLESVQRLLAEATTPNGVPESETMAAIEVAHSELEQLEKESDIVLERQRTTVTSILGTSVQSVFVIAAALAAVSIGLVLLALFLVRRVIVQPVVALAGAAEQVASGDLNQRVRVTNADEIGTLQRSFNTMVGMIHQRTERLQHQVERAEAAQAAEARLSRDELATQLVVSEQIAATLELEPLLALILEQLERIEPFDAAAIYTLEAEELVVRAFRSAIVTRQVQGVHVNLARAGALRTLLTTHQPLIRADRATNVEELAYLETVLGDTCVVHAWMGIPLIAKERVIGVLALCHHQAGYYGAQAQARVQLFANQAAVAIENAHLHRAAQEAAVLEERHRIARDLHDAVTQSLFSASLIAEALRESRKVPARERQSIEDLRQLTRGAQAEMRALLYELHPAGQTEKPLGQLLDTLCTAFTNRTRIPVALTLTGSYQFEPQVQEMLYRIAQEALNNIGKHAAASAARVALTCSKEEVVLSIADDGRGFDLSNGAAVLLGMGMESMRERAAKIGAVLRIESLPGHGTTITVVWRAPIVEPVVHET